MGLDKGTGGGAAFTWRVGDRRACIVRVRAEPFRANEKPPCDASEPTSPRHWKILRNRYRLAFAMPALIDLATAAGRRAWTQALLAPMDEARWDVLARGLFAWQAGRVPAYRRLCAAHGVSPGALKSWREIPAMPQQVFKREKLFHGTKKPGAIYETSGTTTGQPGRQHLLSTDIYRAVSVEGARRAGLFKTGLSFHFLTPSPAEAPHSSLSAMFGFWQKAHRRRARAFGCGRGEFDLRAPARDHWRRKSNAGDPSRFADRRSASSI